MSETFSERQQNISQSWPIEDILAHWPLLRSPEGIKLEFIMKCNKPNLKYIDMRLKRIKDKLNGNKGNNIFFIIY